MKLPIKQVIQGNNAEVLARFPANSIDLIITSPPYDPVVWEGDRLITLCDKRQLREYFGYTWDFVKTAAQIVRVLKPGGSLIWIVADTALKPGQRAGTPGRQCEYFQRLGLWLFDTLYYETDAQMTNDGRYRNDITPMFVLTKGRIAYANIQEVPTKHKGKKQTQKYRRAAGHLEDVWDKGGEYNATKPASKVWYFPTNQTSAEEKFALRNGAVFPEGLAYAHILSWARLGYIICDPFSGGGTTAKIAELLGYDWIAIDVAPGMCEITTRRVEETRAKITGAALPALPLAFSEHTGKGPQQSLFTLLDKKEG